jgi:hypothetical protein
MCSALALCTVFSEGAFLTSPVDGSSRSSLKALFDASKPGGANSRENKFRCDELLDEETASRVTTNTMTPRAARIEVPLQTLFASGLIMSPANAATGAKNFKSTMLNYFPKALSTSDVSIKVRAALAARGFTRYNTLFGTSTSPDEINSKPKESIGTVLGDYLSKNVGVYAMGGLGGLPLMGVRGMEDFLSHCPHKGKAFILFGPNVGISNGGTIGKIERLGQAKLSECCEPSLFTITQIQEATKEAAAAREAAAAAAREAEETAEPETAAAPEAVKAAPVANSEAPKTKTGTQQYNALDNQQEFILANLRKYFDTPEGLRVPKSDLPAFATMQMFKLGQDMIMEQLEACLRIEAKRENIDEIVLLGGIIISRGQLLGSIEPREDYFQPLVFESYNGELDEDGKLEGLDLFAANFGDLPTFQTFS